MPKLPDKEIREQLVQSVVALKSRGMLPVGYGKKVVARMKELDPDSNVTENKVHQIIAGRSSRLDIIEQIIILAEENRTPQMLLKRANWMLS